MIAPREFVARAPRAVLHATQKRHKRAQAARYVSVVRVLGVAAILMVPIIAYVMLTANLTGLNYAVSHATHERAVLQADVARLDDRIAGLQSRERLATIATKLGMREPHMYAVVALPQVAQAHKASGVALLDWFKTP